MRVAISQPAYLPWLGYFDLMDQCDAFVLLDSVQFEKQSWQQRNRIKTPLGLQWLTVPVEFRGRLGQKINEVEIRQTDFFKNHLRAIELNYRRAPHFERYFPGLAEIVESASPATFLADLTIRLIEWFREELGIHTRLLRSSGLPAVGRRSELLVNLCKGFDADSYLSPRGSSVYLLDELSQFEDAGIAIMFQHYEHPEYPQQFPPFCPFASVLDLLFNVGEGALEIVRSGRRAPLQPHELAEISQQESRG